MELSCRKNGYKCAPYVPLEPKYLYPVPTSIEYGTTSNLDCAGSKSFDSGLGIEDLMKQKGELIHSRIELVLTEIYQRHKLKDENLYEICRDQCACKNLLYEMDDYTWDRKRVDMERKIIDLEQEKRKEKANYFRDILFLKKELRESFLERVEEKQKTALFLN